MAEIRASLPFQNASIYAAAAVKAINSAVEPPCADRILHGEYRAPPSLAARSPEASQSVQPQGLGRQNRAEQGGTPNTAVGVDLPAFGMSLWIYSPSSFGVMVDSYLESPGVLIDLNSMQVLFLGARHTSAYAYSNDILKR